MLLNLIQVKKFDIRKFAEALEKSAQEGVKWGRRKLEWILEERKLSGTNDQGAA